MKVSVEPYGDDFNTKCDSLIKERSYKLRINFQDDFTKFSVILTTEEFENLSYEVKRVIDYSEAKGFRAKQCPC